MRGGRPLGLNWDLRTWGWVLFTGQFGGPFARGACSFDTLSLGRQQIHANGLRAFAHGLRAFANGIATFANGAAAFANGPAASRRNGVPPLRRTHGPSTSKRQAGLLLGVHEIPGNALLLQDDLARAGHP